MVYYNEWEPFAAQWLRNLVAEGLLPAGDVDERSITDVRAGDLRGYDQCHFFAGIGGWTVALRLAGVPDDYPLWTGSCPCQPFSHAGSEKGFADKRHLWPVWFDLIREIRPALVLGEQVPSAIKHGWLDLVCDDLEGQGYAVRASVLGACSVGSPHMRQRLYWVGHSDGLRLDEQRRAEGVEVQGEPPEREGIEQQAVAGHARLLQGRPERLGWDDCEWVECSDGYSRAVEPGTPPLAHGIPQVVGQLRAYGNAIVPPVAAEFVAALMEGL